MPRMITVGRGAAAAFTKIAPLSIIIAATALSLALAASSGRPLIQEWSVPSGSFPHDPAFGPDGALWYTGMASNTIGRVDPKTGKVYEYRIEMPDSGPHGLVADRDGNIWFTANYKGYIGRLDIGTGRITRYPMPDSEARDPHTPVFDQAGILWFTVQGGNFIGRLDPETGKVRLKKLPVADSRPYGIAVNSKGVPFFCEFGRNRIASIDPVSLEIREYPLPEGARPRRIAIAADETIYYTDYARGRLGRLDPASGEVVESLSPGGGDSGPYGIAVTPDGMIWYSESRAEPNTLVRFDPKGGAFASWPIPSGGGTVRHMVSTPMGDLFIACSGVDRVGVVHAGR